MTERGLPAIARDASSFRIGPSRLAWEGDALRLEVDERTAPWPRRLRGRIRLWPEALPGRIALLAAEGSHRWWPIAPRARVEVVFDEPALRFTGSGYLDANEGLEPLETRFHYWDWSRAGDDEETVILYEGTRRDGSILALALRAGRDGGLEPLAPPPRQPLPRSRWGLARSTRVDPGHRARLVRSLEDGPFYARALLATRLAGHTLPAIHETLSLDRFARPWVQLLLPFRMPRRGGRSPHRAELPDREGEHSAQNQQTLEQDDGAGLHGRNLSLRGRSGEG